MSCKKCRQNKCTCHNNDCEVVDVKCVIYNSDGSPSDLNCIADIAPKTSLKEILETWDKYFCGLFETPIIDCVKEILNIPQETETLSNTRLLTYILNWICNLEDINVKASPSDTKSGYLDDKIECDECMIKSLLVDEETGEQKVKIALDFACIAAKIPLCFEITPAPCFEIDCSTCQGQCEPKPLTPVISRTGLVLTGTNCNGGLQWFNDNNVLIGTGTSVTVDGGHNYYAKCQTACGLSESSNVITVPPVTIYKKVRKANFTRNNCGVNECNIACVGSTITYEKEYTSTISQADADAKAENDTAFATDGQNLANTNGTCTCPDCNCVFPKYNSNVIVNNATCNGNVVLANGQITIGGISDANRFGYSFGTDDYSGVSYVSATALQNFASGTIEVTPTTIKIKSLSIETKVVVRLFNQNNTCYTDIKVTLTPPDCTKENINIVDVTVSCELPDNTCKNWSIVAGNTLAKIAYFNCNTQKYVFEDVTANTTVTRCSSVEPSATNAVVTQIGNC